MAIPTDSRLYRDVSDGISAGLDVYWRRTPDLMPIHRLISAEAAPGGGTQFTVRLMPSDPADEDTPPFEETFVVDHDDKGRQRAVGVISRLVANAASVLTRKRKLISFAQNQSLAGDGGDIRTGVACIDTFCGHEYLTRAGAQRQTDKYGRETRFSWCENTKDCGSETFLVVR